MQLCGAGDRNDPRLLSEQPGKGDLGRCGLLLLRDLAKQINKGPVRLSSLWRGAGKLVREVGAIKRRVLVDRTRKEAFAQRTEGTNPIPCSSSAGGISFSGSRQISGISRAGAKFLSDITASRLLFTRRCDRRN
jgi:hypothetical protein